MHQAYSATLQEETGAIQPQSNPVCSIDSRSMRKINFNNCIRLIKPYIRASLGSLSSDICDQAAHQNSSFIEHHIFGAHEEFCRTFKPMGDAA